MPRTPTTDQSLLRIGAALQSARHDVGLSIPDAAAALGVSLGTVRKWESGERCPPLAQLPRIAKAFGVEPWKLARRIFDAIG